MARTGFLHHIGSFMLLVATALIIVTNIAAPVVDDIGLLKVQLGSTSSADEVSFGTFGYCVINYGPSRNFCSNSMVGYSPADVMTEIDGTPFSGYAVSSTNSLTKVMILHPIAAGFTFIAFVMALGAGMAGSLMASLVAAVAFLITVIALICDFVLFAVIRSNVNDQNNGSYAYYSIGMWTLLVGAICSLLGTVILFVTCCSARLHRRREVRTKGDGYVADGYAPPTTRRRWWSRR